MWDAEAVRHIIRGVELAKFPGGHCQVLVLITGKDKEDVPIATEVWSVDV